LAVEGGTHTRLLLQRRGPDAARRHLARDILRFFSLAALDSGAFLGLRAVLRLLRDDSFAGPAVADALRVVFPRGILGGTEFVLALVIGLFLTGAYGRGDSRRDAGRVVRGVAVAVTLALWTTFWRGDTSLVLLQASVMVLTFWAGLMIGRLAFEALVRLVFNIPAEGQPIVFVGDRDDVDAQRIHGLLRGQAEARRTTSWVNVRTAPDGAPLEAPERTVDRLHGSISAVNAHTVVLCGDFAKPTFEAVVEAASSAGLRVLSAARLSGVMERRTGMVWYSGAPFVELTVPGFKSWQLIVKRAVDFAAAGVGLVLLSPLFAVIAAAIRRDSEGPVFFSQERVGYAGVVFRVHKFRTMRVTAEAEKGTMAHLNASGDQRLFKIPSDPRVTQLGALLRRWSLDELPQLFNVLSGEMSLVGPRPFFEADLKDYLDHHYSRLGAKPGITGLWQVTGRSAVLDFEEVVRLDREYIERWSVWLDLSILLRTIPAVFRGRGAY
jgi:exopolysaccharide biosynthesis polyprenyl glycosylphosphotransferase